MKERASGGARRQGVVNLYVGLNSAGVRKESCFGKEARFAIRDWQVISGRWGKHRMNYELGLKKPSRLSKGGVNADEGTNWHAVPGVSLKDAAKNFQRVRSSDRRAERGFWARYRSAIKEG